MSYCQQFCFFGILFLGTMSLCKVASADSPFNYPAPSAIDYQKPEDIRPDLYPKNNLCHSILASEWRYYQRQKASGASYPDTEAVRLQRKWETKKGCAHLYEVDGTVNRVPGIND
jgi:hypothetical protein